MGSGGAGQLSPKPRTWWERIGNALVYSHVWIGLGAAGQVLLAGVYRAQGFSSALFCYALLVFAAGVSFYSFHRLYSLWKVLPHLREERWRVIFGYQRLLFALVPLGVIVAAVCFVFLPRHWQIQTIIPAIVSAAYALPLVRGKRMRDFGAGKVIWLSIGWVWLCTLVPFAAGGDVPKLLVAERLCFLVALTLPFDYRDLAHDATEGVRTLPQILGRQGCRVVSLVLLFAGIGLLLLHDVDGYDELAGHIVLLVQYVLTLPLVFVAYRTRPLHHLYYGSVLDGLLLLPAVLIFCLWYYT